MDTGVGVSKNPNPVENANPLSVITFSYMFPIFRKTFKEQLTEDDLFRPLKEYKSSEIGSRLERIWKEEYRIHKKTALYRAIFRLFGFKFALYGFLRLLNELMLIVVMPLCIGKLVSFFDVDQKTISQNEALSYAGCLVLCLLVDAFVGHPTLMGLQHLAMKIRVSCSSLVYRKILRFSRTALGNTTVGQLVNLLSNDVSKFDQMFGLVHYVWIGPIQVGLGTWLLYKEIGISAFFGVAFLVSFVPIQIWLAKRASVLRLRTALRTDERVRLMNEIISGIQVIKMYCWEKSFEKLIAFARRTEMKAIRSRSVLLGIIYSFEIFISRTSIFISILGYVLLGNYISAEKVFAITAIYNCLRPTITILFSLSVSSLAEMSISISRLQGLLYLDEKEEDTSTLGKKGKEFNSKRVNSPELNSKTSNGMKNGILEPVMETYQKSNTPKIMLEKVCAKWNKESTEDTLSNITFSITSSKLLAIVGPVGSGKSSILNLILKELPVKSGKLKILGKISYASQDPWLFAASVRQNILFGEEFDQERYERVVDVCALSSDFDLLPYGDKTLVGEKGKTLSGGQKARINLARCIYRLADIYLLDDPLSAVDANVGKHLYERCIREFLANKICVLVTHQLQYLKEVDNIIIMEDGEVQMEGTYQELQKSGLDFTKIMEDFQGEEVDEKEKKKKVRSRQNTIGEEDDSDDEEQSLEKETMESGSIKGATYWAYLKAGGGKLSISFLIFLFIACQVVANGGEYYVTYWVNLEQDFAEKVAKNQTNANETLDRDSIIYYYSAITVGTIAIALIKSIFFMVFFSVASRNLHDYIFSRIIKATMRFYNNNPSGRILNRFSKDLGTVDEYIPSVILDVMEIFLLLLGVIVLSSIVNAWLLLPSLFLIILFYFIRVVYIETSRAVKRIEAITKSPIFSHMTATIHGLGTIRAFAAQDMLVKEFDNYQDMHSSAWFLYMASSRCFGLWLDLICITFIAVATFFLLLFGEAIHGGDLGLVITQYIGLIGSLQWGMRQWSEMENNMTSVERILEYTKLESEPERAEIKDLPKNWPEKGQIEFKNVYLKYSEADPPVLKNLNFIIKPKEKIGIVGRTGAGKSSTITALFQLYPVEGSIKIDDVDTTKMPLDQVRSQIAIIPQEPVLFSGSMRKNLDPFDQYSDDVLWDALDQVELKEEIAELPAGLNTKVSEGGTNFSVGQRQLVCLARAIIRNNKILVLDEATANVDPHTDALIQNTLREKFVDCSVFTIAHRLHTVMDSDKILVMNAGTVEEYDHPYILLQNENGVLRSLVEATGYSTSKHLESIAEENYLKKKNE
nr:probable multidrug resistance-associated protein lethal(2)03659 [Leptinotarsa decemlineata]